MAIDKDAHFFPFNYLPTIALNPTAVVFRLVLEALEALNHIP
jgi:hypothetical protein